MTTDFSTFAIPFGEAVAGVAAVALTRGSLPLAAAALALWALRTRSPAVRHAVGVAAIVALPLTVVAHHLLPAWRAAPAWSVAGEPASAEPAATVVPRTPPAPAPVLPPRPRLEPPPTAARAPKVTTAPAVVAPAVVAPTAPAWSRAALAGWVVTGGAALLVLRLLVSAVHLRRAAGRAGAWGEAEEIAGWKAELGVRRPVAVRVARGETMPLAFGAFRPTVLLPVSFPAWPAGRRRAVGLHELAHVARRDPLRQGLTETVRALGWFHPLLWIVAAQTARAREEACDDLVLGRSVPPAEYARTLVALAAGSRRRRPALGTALTAPDRVERRVRRLFDPRRRSAPLSRVCLTGVTLATALLALGTATLGTAAPADPPASPTPDDPAVPDEPPPPAAEPPDADGILWDDARHGWRVGAKLLMAGERLEPGDPLAIQFYLKNVAEESRIRVIEQFEGLFPTLSAGNELTLNLSAHTDQRWRHEVEPGEVLRERQYRVTLDTAGLPPGEYQVNIGAVFWSPDPERENTHTSLGFRRPLSVTIGDPAETTYAEPPPTPGVTWGEPVAGLAVGLKPLGGSTIGPVDVEGTTVEGAVFAANLTKTPITFTWDVPQTMDWIQNVEGADGDYESLHQIWFSGFRVPATRSVTLKPGEVRALTGAAADTKRENAREVTAAPGPKIRVQQEKTEPNYGDAPQLVTDGGDYRWFVSIEATRPEIPDLSLILTTGGSPVTVAGRTEEKKAAPHADAAPAAGEATDEPPGAMPGAENDGVVWDEPRDGWQVGAYIVTDGDRLEPGDPLVIQLLLKNASERTQTPVVEHCKVAFPTLQHGNVLTPGALEITSAKRRYSLKPGEVLRKQEHRQTLDTTGLPPGEYRVDVFTAFYLPGRAVGGAPGGLGLRRPIFVTIGDPAAMKLADPPATPGVTWGSPVAGLAVGLEPNRDSLPGPSGQNGEAVEATVYAANLTDQPISFTWDVPQPGGWTQYVERTDSGAGAFHEVERVGRQDSVEATVTLKPHEVQPLTGMESVVREKGALAIRRLDGPGLTIQTSSAAADVKASPRLVTDGGAYRWSALVHANRTDLPGFSLLLNTGGAPLMIAGKEAD